MGKKQNKKKKANSASTETKAAENPHKAYLKSIKAYWAAGNYGNVRVLSRQRPEGLSDAQHKEIDDVLGKVTLAPRQLALFAGALSFIILAGILTLQF